ncbi:MAG: hypothetical protein EOO27_01680 [Comamonadaceae bacterium]|nr:MAG: hypothetical protein EOO27_01680 [Comamonadaceae bacterium]
MSFGKTAIERIINGSEVRGVIAKLNGEEVTDYQVRFKRWTPGSMHGRCYRRNTCKAEALRKDDE